MPRSAVEARASNGVEAYLRCCSKNASSRVHASPAASSSKSGDPSRMNPCPASGYTITSSPWSGAHRVDGFDRDVVVVATEEAEHRALRCTELLRDRAAVERRRARQLDTLDRGRRVRRSSPPMQKPVMPTAVAPAAAERVDRSVEVEPRTCSGRNAPMSVAKSAARSLRSRKKRSGGDGGVALPAAARRTGGAGGRSRCPRGSPRRPAMEDRRPAGRRTVARGSRRSCTDPLTASVRRRRLPAGLGPCRGGMGRWPTPRADVRGAAPRTPVR